MANDQSWENPGTRANPGVALSAIYRAVSGGGGDEVTGTDGTYSFVASNGIADGETITFTSSLSNFGTRSNAAPRIYVRGDQAWIRGTPKVLNEASMLQGDAIVGATDSVGASETASSVFRTVQDTHGYPMLAERSDVGTLSNFAYRAQYAPVGSFVDGPSYLDPATTGKGYVAFKQKASADLYGVVRVGFTGATGNFTETDGVQPGEEVTCNGLTGRFIHLDTSTTPDTYIVEFDGTYSASTLNGFVMTGVSSGVTATLQTPASGGAYARYSSGKYIRYDSRLASDRPGGESQVGYFLNWIGVSNLTCDSAVTNPTKAALRPAARTWQTVSIAIDAEDSTTAVNSISMVGSSVEVVAGTTTATQIAEAFYCSLLGADFAGGSDPNIPSGAVEVLVRDFVEDDDIACVIFGDASTFASCSDTVTIQRSVSWSEGSCAVVANLDDLPGAIYAYFRNNAGTIVNAASGLLMRAA